VPDIRISLEEVHGLADKLDGFELTENERALLSGIFTLANDMIARAPEVAAKPLVTRMEGDRETVTVHTETPLPSLGDQFRDAFSPEFLGNGSVQLSARRVTGPYPPPGSV
jgi:hypothetical protein